MLKDTPQGSNPITNPEEGEEEENEGNRENEYASYSFGLQHTFIFEYMGVIFGAHGIMKSKDTRSFS